MEVTAAITRSLPIYFFHILNVCKSNHTSPDLEQLQIYSGSVSVILFTCSDTRIITVLEMGDISVIWMKVSENIMIIIEINIH
jgi:hypothetical protein